VARPLDLDELLKHFTLADDELELLRNKSGATRLGFGLLLKYLASKGRFPRGRGELPENAVEHVARQVGVLPEELGLYDWRGRQSKRHRVEVRQHLGFRECSVADADKLTAWLAEHVAQAERRPERVREALLAHCYAERIEPPTAGRIDRMVASALHQGPNRSCRCGSLLGCLRRRPCGWRSWSSPRLLTLVPTRRSRRQRGRRCWR
jgi:hypothetical protein